MNKQYLECKICTLYFPSEYRGKMPMCNSCRNGNHRFFYGKKSKQNLENLVLPSHHVLNDAILNSDNHEGIHSRKHNSSGWIITANVMDKQCRFIRSFSAINEGYNVILMGDFKNGIEVRPLCTKNPMVFNAAESFNHFIVHHCPINLDYLC